MRPLSNSDRVLVNKISSRVLWISIKLLKARFSINHNKFDHQVAYEVCEQLTWMWTREGFPSIIGTIFPRYLIPIPLSWRALVREDPSVRLVTWSIQSLIYQSQISGWRCMNVERDSQKAGFVLWWGNVQDRESSLSPSRLAHHFDQSWDQVRRYQD